MSVLSARALLGVAALLTVSACASPDGSPPAGAAPSAVPAGALVLRVDYTGGFTTPADTVTRLPMISVYADGRVITNGPMTLQYPGDALPNLQIRQLDAAAVDQLVERAVSAGVQNGVDLGQPGIADAMTTRFTVLTAQGVQVIEAYALAESTGADQGLSAGQVRDRALLGELVAALDDLPATLGADRVEDVTSYRPAEIAAVASPWQPADPTLDLAHPELRWPGPELPGASLGAGLDLGCVSATGQAAADVWTAAQEASAITPWTSGGRKWSVQLRPLLPDEHTCDALTGNS